MTFKFFMYIAKLCGNRKQEASVIIGILQAVRDNCLLDYTTTNEMLNLVYNQRKNCTKNYTQPSTKMDTIISLN